MPPPVLALAKSLRQRLTGVGLALVTGTTRLRTRRLPLPLATLLDQIRPARSARIPDFRDPLPTPRRTLSEPLAQLLSGVGLPRITSTTRLHPRRLPQLLQFPLRQFRPGQTALIPDFRKPGFAPRRALSELRPQRVTGMGLTRVTSTTCLRTRCLSHPLPPLSAQTAPGRIRLARPSLRPLGTASATATARTDRFRRTKTAISVGKRHRRPHHCRIHILVLRREPEIGSLEELGPETVLRRPCPASGAPHRLVHVPSRPQCLLGHHLIKRPRPQTEAGLDKARIDGPRRHLIRRPDRSRIERPRARIVPRLSSDTTKLTTADRILQHRGVRSRIRPRASLDGQTRAPRAQLRRQLPGKPHRLGTAVLTDTRRNQSDHIIQRHIRLPTGQRHHIMRALHDPLCHGTRPTQSPGALDFPTQNRLRPLPHTGRIRLFHGGPLQTRLGPRRLVCAPRLG